MGVPTPQCLKTQPSTDAVQSTPYTPDAAPGRGPGGNSFLGLGGPGLDTVWACVSKLSLDSPPCMYKQTTKTTRNPTHPTLLSR